MGCGGCERKVYNQHLKLKSFLQHLELNYQTIQPQTLENFLELLLSKGVYPSPTQICNTFSDFELRPPVSARLFIELKSPQKGVECVSVCVSRVNWTKVRSSLRRRPPKINWRPKRSYRLDRVWIVLGIFTAHCMYDS